MGGRAGAMSPGLATPLGGPRPRPEAAPPQGPQDPSRKVGFPASGNLHVPRPLQALPLEGAERELGRAGPGIPPTLFCILH